MAILPRPKLLKAKCVIAGLFRKPMQSTHRRKKRRKTLPGMTADVDSVPQTYHACQLHDAAWPTSILSYVSVKDDISCSSKHL